MSNSETFSLLQNVFGDGNVIAEWGVGNESQDALQRGLQYCPRIDFAIKPLNTTRNWAENRLRMRAAKQNYHQFFQDLKYIGLSNSNWNENNNPRCFVAIEYENKTTTKHRLGSLINACALGNVGIVVAVNDKTYRSYERIIKYLEFLQINDKMPVHPNNYILLKRNDFENFLRR